MAKFLNPFGFLFIPIWIGLLALPFVGWPKAIGIAGVIALGKVIWFWSVRLSQTPRIKTFASHTRDRLEPLLQWRPVPRQRFLLLTGLVAVLLVVPLELNNYLVDVLTLAGIYVILALGLNIVVGMAGLLDLGYISFYAIGAYTYALGSTQWGVPFWMGLPLGGLTAAGFGLLLGLVTLRLRGDYIAIVTLGFVQIVYLILNNWDRVTNGPNGILNIGRPAIGDFILSRPIHFYYLILLIVCLTVFVVIRLNQSRIGRAWIAIREDETAAQAVGVNTTQMKLLAFSMGATLAGVAGVFFAAKFSFISPESFTFKESVIVLTMVVLGGMGSISGVILGAVILVILPEVLRGFESYRMLVFGGLMVLMMIFRPQGLIGNPRRKVELDPNDQGGLFPSQLPSSEFRESTGRAKG